MTEGGLASALWRAGSQAVHVLQDTDGASPSTSSRLVSSEWRASKEGAAESAWQRLVPSPAWGHSREHAVTLKGGAVMRDGRSATRLTFHGLKHVCRARSRASSVPLTFEPSSSMSIDKCSSTTEVDSRVEWVKGNSRLEPASQPGALRLRSGLTFSMKCLSIYFRLNVLGTVCAEALAFS